MIPIKDTNPTRKFAYLTIIIIILNVYVFILQKSLDGNEEEFFFFNHSVIPKCFIASLRGPDAYDAAIEETKSFLTEAITNESFNAYVNRYRIRLLTISQEERLKDQLRNEARNTVDEKFHRRNLGFTGVVAEILSIFSSMFIHGSIMHLIGNMWFLWIFGNNIEDILGVIKFVVFYLLCGIFAAFGHILFSLNSVVPTIGASGAISGVLGAYIIIYPHARILTFIPIGWFLWMEDLPAYVFLGYWIVIQILFAAFSNPFTKSSGGVAWVAHIAGFFAGVLLVILFKGRKKYIYGQEESESIIELFDDEEDDGFSRR